MYKVYICMYLHSKFYTIFANTIDRKKHLLLNILRKYLLNEIKSSVLTRGFSGWNFSKIVCGMAVYVLTSVKKRYL